MLSSFFRKPLKLSLKDAVTNLFTAWHKVEKETIAKCWNNILNVPVDNSDSEDDIPLNILQQKFKNSTESKIMQNTIELLEVVNPNLTYSKEDIITWNKSDIQIVPESDNIIEEIERSDKSSKSYQKILPLIKFIEMATKRLCLHN